LGTQAFAGHFFIDPPALQGYRASHCSGIAAAVETGDFTGKIAAMQHLSSSTYLPLPDGLQQRFLAAQQHRVAHGCSAHPFGDGAALYALVQAQQPAHILELGSGVGYTAVLMAQACPSAHIDTLEGNENHIAEASQAFAEASLAERITLHAGSFADTLGPLPLNHYDLIFFDGHIPPLIVVQHFAKLMRMGGLLVCSNMRLKGTRGAPRIEAELSKTENWQRLPDIEGGNTWVLRRV
jgi:predicted O-methyltransferase YrrM